MLWVLFVPGAVLLKTSRFARRAIREHGRRPANHVAEYTLGPWQRAGVALSPYGEWTEARYSVNKRRDRQAIRLESLATGSQRSPAKNNPVYPLPLPSGERNPGGCCGGRSAWCVGDPPARSVAMAARPINKSALFHIGQFIL